MPKFLFCSLSLHFFYRLTKSPFRKEQDLGYCPQEDACDPLLTARELLEFYARLRGYPSSAVSGIATLWLKRLQLDSYADKISKNYSGGTKRKLCVASALLGKPKMILMDEPTSGMDPGTRRMVWSNLNSVLREGRSILLTSHSMEECDAVCGRLAIMVNGKLRCIGSPQHLKQRYYTVISRVHITPRSRFRTWKKLYFNVFKNVAMAASRFGVLYS